MKIDQNKTRRRGPDDKDLLKAYLAGVEVDMLSTVNFSTVEACDFNVNDYHREDFLRIMQTDDPKWPLHNGRFSKAT